MNNRTIIIIISIILLGTISGAAYWYYTNRVTPSSPLSQFPGEAGTGAGQGVVPTETTTPNEDSSFTPGSGAMAPRLYELHKVPVGGTGFFETKDKKGLVTGTSVRYIERGLGYIFETPLDTYSESRIVNEARSGIAEALWGNGGKSVVIRSIDDKNGDAITTHILNIAPQPTSFTRSTSSEPLKTDEFSLPYYIPFMATSEDGADKLFYLETGINAAAGSTATFKNTGVSSVFNSSFTEWLPQFPNQSLVTLTTKPSASVLGYLYFLNPKTKSVAKILDGINGLTTLTSHDGKMVLYAETKASGPELSLYDVSKKTTRALNLRSLPEKCAWGNKKTTMLYCAIPGSIPAGSYPDQWYQGLVSFSDKVVSIDTTNLSQQELFVTKALGAPALDIINPVLSTEDSYFLFMNKISGTPWVYSITLPLPTKTIVSQPTPTTSSASPAGTTTTSSSIPTSVVTSDMKKLN